jgi:cytochrome c553
LGACKQSGRGRTGEGELLDPMQEISHELSPSDIRAVSAYFASMDGDWS